MLRELYPFSTIDGKVIPLDIIRPLGILRIPFTAISTALQDLGIATPIMILSATEDCFVRFGAAAVVPSTSLTSNQIMVEKDQIVIVAPHNPNFSVISDGVNGSLTIQLLDRWAGLADEASYRN